jgi:sulfonate dioxygenase
MATSVTLPATSESTLASNLDKVHLKEDQAEKVFNPFYSPSIGDDGDNAYEFSRYKVSRVGL